MPFDTLRHALGPELARWLLALPLLVLTAALAEGLVQTFVRREGYDWRAFAASMADALGRHAVGLAGVSLAAPVLVWAHGVHAVAANGGHGFFCFGIHYLGCFFAWKSRLVLCLMCVAFLLPVCLLIWPHVFAPAFFTALRTRYRFNRTTRKVYVLRPRKYGGNAILDWDRVKAHVKWAPPKSWTAEQLASSEEARRERLLSAGIDSNLLLYWPPFDPADPERKGEDVIWVGPNDSGEPLWQYIRTFMKEGMDAVPKPAEYNWLRKGFSSPGQHMEETVMHGSLVRDKMVGQGTSAATATNFGLNVLWAPLHTLAERLCYWPTFPEEWNSDCGQKRRESGIGPEEPLRWVAKV